MKVKLWVSTYVDHGPTCDGKARILGIDKTKEEAEARVRNDIESWIDDRASEGVEADFDKKAAWYDYDTDDCCEWNIEEQTIDVDEEDEQTASEVEYA